MVLLTEGSMKQQSLPLFGITSNTVILLLSEVNGSVSLTISSLLQSNGRLWEMPFFKNQSFHKIHVRFPYTLKIDCNKRLIIFFSERRTIPSPKQEKKDGYFLLILRKN